MEVMTMDRIHTHTTDDPERLKHLHARLELLDAVLLVLREIREEGALDARVAAFAELGLEGAWEATLAETRQLEAALGEAPAAMTPGP
jgi:hypothetical protein